MTIKSKPCNLTKKDWALFAEIFQYFHDEHDLSDKEVKHIESIHQKIIFMDFLVKEQES
jgi:hypothetical protein